MSKQFEKSFQKLEMVKERNFSDSESPSFQCLLLDPKEEQEHPYLLQEHLLRKNPLQLPLVRGNEVVIIHSFLCCSHLLAWVIPYHSFQRY